MAKSPSQIYQGKRFVRSWGAGQKMLPLNSSKGTAMENAKELLLSCWDLCIGQPHTLSWFMSAKKMLFFL